MQISFNAIHRRVIFAQFALDTLQSWLATAESVIGVVIEGVFVAMIIQRLFHSLIRHWKDCMAIIWVCGARRKVCGIAGRFGDACSRWTCGHGQGPGMSLLDL
jgi:hypothetical protein